MIRSALHALAAGGLLALTIVVPPAPAQTAPPPAGIEQAIRDALTRDPTILRDVMRANPDILRDALVAHPDILGDAIAAYEEWREKKAAEEQLAFIRENRRRLENAPMQGVIGNASGDIVLVEFVDYNCTFCAQMLPIVVDLVRTEPRLRVVLKDLPLLGRPSLEAARVALALKRQISDPARYLRFHQTLMTMRGVKGREQALQVARDVGADMARLQRDMEAEEINAALIENEELAVGLRLRGTPAYLLGETIVPGAVPAERMAALIAQAKTARPAR